MLYLLRKFFENARKAGLYKDLRYGLFYFGILAGINIYTLLQKSGLIMTSFVKYVLLYLALAAISTFITITDKMGGKTKVAGTALYCAISVTAAYIINQSVLSKGIAIHLKEIILLVFLNVVLLGGPLGYVLKLVRFLLSTKKKSKMKFVYLETHRALNEEEIAVLNEGSTVIVYGYFKNAEPCTAILISKKPTLVNKYVWLEPSMQGEAQFLVEILENTPYTNGETIPKGTMCLVHNIFVEI